MKVLERKKFNLVMNFGLFDLKSLLLNIILLFLLFFEYNGRVIFVLIICLGV